jgi:hypothetical protein
MDLSKALADDFKKLGALVFEQLVMSGAEP